MKNNSINIILQKDRYTSPICVEHEIQQEGPLCASVEQSTEGDEYGW